MSARSPVYLHFFWHQHQPWYVMPGTNRCRMPWVRLHGVKDYYDMAYLSEQFTGWKQTINFAPSLLIALQGYADGTMTDTAFELSRKPAKELTPEEKQEILARFFDCHPPRMIQPYPRYNELFHRRGTRPNRPMEPFSEQDIRDLQVWFNLSWIDPIWRDVPSSPLPELLEKQRGFSEEDKQIVLKLHLDILKEIIPLHRQLKREKKIELTVSPYYHPILPLLCDNRVALISNPHDSVPDPPFAFPEDADWHIREGINLFERMLGFRPIGMWPSEGSVSDQACARMAKAGISYFATDEGILYKSLQVDGGKPATAADLYRLHVLNTPEGEIRCVFRNHELSDLIGFIYSKMDAKEAAQNFISRIKQIGRDWKDKTPPLVSVILDGENCWEFYERDGHDFLKYLITGILEEPQIQAVSVPEFAALYPPVPSLKSIYPGSWINQNFRIWIGHPEDNSAWHFLRQARELLVQEAPRLEPAIREQAWNEIHICEGSDWFWWYGDENVSALDTVFDLLFRSHLAHLYELIGKPIPEAVKRSIKQPKVVWSGGGTFFQKPNLSGKTQGYYDWIGSHTFHITETGGAMHPAETMTAELHYGRQDGNLCFLLQFKEAIPLTPDSEILVQISKPVVKSLPIFPRMEGAEITFSPHHIGGCVDLQKAGIAPHQEIWFFLQFSAPGMRDVSIPQGSELYLQGLTPANANIYWFL